MFRFFLTTFIATTILSACWPWLARIGVGRLPGDLRFRMFGRHYLLPFTSTVILSLLGMLLVRLL
ncbi:DUF2905 domain-containing protein [Chitinasiproducens palmae]|uniref:DUF2905 domain-containing protein n=1 Tax=Chitinasiproducens palmae TaxID=1770053 RepID=A0A1H2PTB9_9BURK|nr:DUF2905 domain-containing protein [Chitinasiproducens palmae]SDV50331.1 Protein of unknown function [Chitinasiproducens palmae]